MDEWKKESTPSDDTGEERDGGDGTVEGSSTEVVGMVEVDDGNIPPADGSDAGNTVSDGGPKEGPVNASGVDGSPAPKATKKRRRWLRVLVYFVITSFVLSGALVSLVYWSTIEHNRLMVESKDSSRLTKAPLFERKLLGGHHKLYRGPSIISTPKGTLLAFAEGRQTGNDHIYIETVMRSSSDLGKTWSPMELLLTQKGLAVGSPSPLVDRDTGTVWLVYRITDRKRGKKTRIWVMSSSDEGKTWSRPRELTVSERLPKYLKKEKVIAPGPGHGIQIQNGKYAGRLVISGSTGMDSRSTLRNRYTGHSFAIYSDDHGKTWEFGKSTDYGGENQIVEVDNGDLLMIIRTRAYRNSKRMKRLARSRDGGHSWEPTYESDVLPAPVCQTTVLRHSTGGPKGAAAVMALQPSGKARGRWDKSARKNFTVWLSADGGKTWPLKRLMHRGGAGYSDATIGTDGKVHVVYETGLKGGKSDRLWSGIVTYAAFNTSWINAALGSQEERPFSEWVYDTYQDIRAPIEERWRRDR